MSPTVMTSAAVAPFPLTTPFVQQGSCASLYTTRTTSDGSFIVITSNSADPAFSGCQPSGWNSNDVTSQFSFSPAVCPSDWTYFNMQRFYTTYEALCCASGFTMVGLYSLWMPPTDLRPSRPCTRTTTITGDAAATTTVLEMHEAWHIAWASSDTASMSPSLPNIGFDEIETWTPGQTISSTSSATADSSTPSPTSRYTPADSTPTTARSSNEESCPGEGCEGADGTDYSGLNTLMIVLFAGILPLLILVGVAVCRTCCWRAEHL